VHAVLVMVNVVGLRLKSHGKPRRLKSLHRRACLARTDDGRTMAPTTGDTSVSVVCHATLVAGPRPIMGRTRGRRGRASIVACNAA
jgi:hypothetical protein